MLKLKELRLSGIGRFVEEQTIDFSTLGNLVQVDGQNNNTGGSSGAGKTTVFNSLDYLFGLNDVPNTVLQSRLTKDPISVMGLFDWDGQELKISRSKKGLSIEVAGSTVEGSSKITEEKLDQIIAMPRHLFRAMLHKRQKEGGFFLQLTPKEIHEFLTDCLGLSDLRKKSELIDKKIKELAELHSTSSNCMDSNKAAQKAVKEALAALGLPPVKDIHQEVVLALKTKMEASQGNLNAILAANRLELESLELERPQSQSISIDKSEELALKANLKAIQDSINQLKTQYYQDLNNEQARSAAIKAEINKNELKISQLQSVVYAADRAKQDAIVLAGEIKKIRAAICPTCTQGWATDTAKAKEIELLAKIEECKSSILLGNQASVEAALLLTAIQLLYPQANLKVIELPPEINRLEETAFGINVQIGSLLVKEQASLDHQNALNKQAQSAFAFSQARLRDKHSATSDQARGQLDLDRRTFEAAAQKLKAYEESRTRYESQLNQININREYYDKKVEEMEKVLSNLHEEFTVAEEVKRAIKSYASCSFDDALEYIGDVASRLIRAIPNMANATIQLEGIKETKEGKLKEEVNAVISSDGEIGIPIKSLSGGERSSVDLAVDLAVIDLIENKTGKGIDTIVLDEPFTGLDTISIEMALEVLKNCNLNKRLIVVDHNPIIKESLSDRIIVIRDGEKSKIVQN